MFSYLLSLLFPPKCHFCRCILQKAETDLCHSCRGDAPELLRTKRKIPLIAQWTAVWYYKGAVRKSILRFKFCNARGYADFYARELALKLRDADFANDFSVITWVPVSKLRRLLRGYDQSELLATALGKELGLPAVQLLKKHRHTQPQSSLPGASQRRANVLNAYMCVDRHSIIGKHILLLDDVLTTGSTAAECGKILLLGGAKKVYFAAIAAATHDKNK